MDWEYIEKSAMHLMHPRSGEGILVDFADVSEPAVRKQRVTTLFVLTDSHRRSVEEAVAAAGKFLNRPAADECATETRAIDMYGNIVSPPRRVTENANLVFREDY